VFGRVDAKRLVIGLGGYLEGDAVADDVHLCGELNGRIFALSVNVAPSAVVKGRIFHHTATVAREARIDGRMPWRPRNFFETLETLPKES
jgi:cytoskeletal protein CcmA (bactofilin family)